jgi:hypothetical protein
MFTGPVLEEVWLPGSGNLRADFYVPHVRMMVEVHGEQHLRYIPYFHGSLAGYLKAKRRDRDKSEWCQINNIRLLVLLDTETDHEWRHRIARCQG